MSGRIHVSAVRVTTQGIRIRHTFEIHDVALRTAATAAVGRGLFLEDWLVALARRGMAATAGPVVEDSRGSTTD